MDKYADITANPHIVQNHAGNWDVMTKIGRGTWRAVPTGSRVLATREQAVAVAERIEAVEAAK